MRREWLSDHKDVKDTKYLVSTYNLVHVVNLFLQLMSNLVHKLMETSTTLTVLLDLLTVLLDLLTVLLDLLTVLLDLLTVLLDLFLLFLL